MFKWYLCVCVSVFCVEKYTIVKMMKEKARAENIRRQQKSDYFCLSQLLLCVCVCVRVLAAAACAI